MKQILLFLSIIAFIGCAEQQPKQMNVKMIGSYNIFTFGNQQGYKAGDTVMMKRLRSFDWILTSDAVKSDSTYISSLGVPLVEYRRGIVQ